MNVLPVGDDALLVEVSSGEEAEALHAELLRRRAEGTLAAREIVPAARTVLLDGLTDPARLASELAAAEVPSAPRARGTWSRSRSATTVRTWPTSPRTGVWRRRRWAASTRVPSSTSPLRVRPRVRYLTGLPRATTSRAATLRARPSRPVRWRWRVRTPACIRVRRRAAGS